MPLKIGLIGAGRIGKVHAESISTRAAAELAALSDIHLPAARELAAKWRVPKVYQELPEAYERLLLDVLRGDSTLFTRRDELEAAWRFVTPILEHWEQSPLDPAAYAAGSWGPSEAEGLLERDGRKWRRPDPSQHNSK